MNRTVTNQELFKAIENSITNKTPLSYIRIGDGEIQILKTPQHCNTPNEVNIRQVALTHICKRYNEVFVEDCSFINKFRKIIKDSIKDGDYVGMFTFEEIDDLMKTGWREGCNYDETIRMYVPNTAILNYYEIDHKKLKICSPVANRFEPIGIIENFKKLIGDQRITIITSETDNLKANKRFKDTFGDNVDFISVKHKHATNTDKAFFQREWVRSHFKDIKNHVILFGLGGAAKDLCNELKNDWGKCVIDMGSVLDAWGGVISRPSYGNIWSQCLTVPVNEAKETNICWR